MIWFQLFLWVASFVLTDYFREALPSVTPSGSGEFNIPTATEGRVVPIAPGGTMRVNAMNCIWYGDFVAESVTLETGIIFKRDEVVGFTYRLALQYALLKNEVAGITGIWVGDEEVYRGVAATVVDVDRDDLFGGAQSGGGFVARFRLFTGSDTQGVSTFLSSRIDPLPAYRGTCYVMVTDIAETEGANIGESNQLRHIRIEVQTFDTLANGGLNNTLALSGDEHIIGADSNPMSVAYELYINTRWGRRFPISDVDIPSFQAAATTCFNEGIGFSVIFDELTSTGNIQTILEKHIDGYIGPNPITGKIEVTLARQGYVLANEFQATPDNIISVKKWNRADWSQTSNKIRVRYTDRAKQWKEAHAVEVAPGNRIIQGRTKIKDLRYEGCHTASVAALLAARGKRSLGQPIDSGTLVINREAYALRPGSVMSVTTDKIKGTNVPTRVTKIGVGNVTMNSVEVDVVRDVFDFESATVADPPPTDFVPPIQVVVPFLAADQAAATVPYTLMQYDDSPGLIPRVVTLARRAAGNTPTRYEVVRRARTTFGSGGYDAFSSMGFVQAGFCTVGTLRAAEGSWVAANGTLTMLVDPIGAESLDGLIGSYSPNSGNAAGIAVISPGAADEEWVAFTGISDNGAGIRLDGLYRSAFDSPMESHLLGARIWFVWTGGMGLPEETFAAGNGVEVKLLPTSPNDAVLEAAATVIAEIDMLNTIRHARPLLPRILTVDSVEFPTTTDIDTPGGLLMGVEARLWNVLDIIAQANGLDLLGSPLTDVTWSALSSSVEWWLYDLDTTPTPVRGVDEILTGTEAWATVIETWLITKASLLGAGVTVDFRARIEIEIEHSPPGETANQLTRVPMLFDFDVTGTWV